MKSKDLTVAMTEMNFIMYVIPLSEFAEIDICRFYGICKCHNLRQEKFRHSE